MKTSEHFALDEWLCEYPEDMTYEQIIKLLNRKKHTWKIDEITVWDVVEDCTLDQVASFIESTRKHFERATS
jgi:hypothetical protein